MRSFWKNILAILLLFSVALVSAEEEKKKAPPPEPPVDTKLDRVRLANINVTDCPARRVFDLMRQQLRNNKINLRYTIKPEMDRSVTVKLANRTLRASLNEMRRYGYSWKVTGRHDITVVPNGDPKKWRSGFGSVRIMNGDASYLNKTIIKNAYFNNAGFTEVEKFIRASKIRLAGGSRTPKRISLSAKNVTLRQFLTAVCAASGLDCEVNGSTLRFRAGKAIGFYPADKNTREKLQQLKYPDGAAPAKISDFLRSAAPSFCWVFLPPEKVSLKYYRYVMPDGIPGSTMFSAIHSLENNLNIRPLYLANNTVVLTPNVAAARREFAEKLAKEAPVIPDEKLPLRKFLDRVAVATAEQDSKKQGVPVMVVGKNIPDQVSAEVSGRSLRSLLDRLALATGHYGYMSACGTCYIFVKSGLFSMEGVTITKLNPVKIQNVPDGISEIDLKLDFKAISLKSVKLENALKFIRVLSIARFGSRVPIRWAVNDSKKLAEQLIDLEVEEPTLRKLLDEICSRAQLSVDVQPAGVILKDY